MQLSRFEFFPKSGKNPKAGRSKGKALFMSMSVLLTDVPVLVPQLVAISAAHQIGTLDDVSWYWIHWIQGWYSTGCAVYEGKPPVLF